MSKYIQFTAEKEWIQKFISATFDGIEGGVSEAYEKGYSVRYPEKVEFELNTGDGKMKFTIPWGYTRDTE